MSVSIHNIVCLWNVRAWLDYSVNFRYKEMTVISQCDRWMKLTDNVVYDHHIRPVLNETESKAGMIIE